MRVLALISIFQFAALVLALVGGRCCFAQNIHREGFEGPGVVWQPVANDAAYRIEVHERMQGQARTGEWCEAFQLQAGNGSYIYLGMPAGQVRVIDELKVSLWLKSDRPGPQLLGRVVLPRSIDCRTGQPLVMDIRGSIYRQAGQWEELRLPDLAREMERQARVLRTQQQAVDLREAYLDQILLNAFAGPGRVQVMIDDLAISGGVARSETPSSTAANAPRGVPAIPASTAATPNSPSPGWNSGGSSDGAGPPTVEIRGSQLIINDRPVFPRAIEYRGEPLEFLRRLGFNAVHLRQQATPELLAEARRLGIWLIAPPPLPDGAQFANATAQARTYLAPNLGADWDIVVGWDLGAGLTATEFDSVRQVAEQVRALDKRSQRPLLCDPLTDTRSYSRYADILYPHRLPLGTALDLNDYDVWLRERPRLARAGTPSWSVIQTQPTWGTLQQWSQAASGPPPSTVADEQMRLLAYSAVTSGAKGLLFESHGRLDADDADTRYRAASLEMLNLELSLIEPWVTTGTLIASVVGSRPEATGALLQAHRSRIFLPQWRTAGAQNATGQAAANNLAFVAPGVPEGYVAYEVSPAGAHRIMNARRAAGGVRIVLPEFDVAGIVLFAEDERAVGAVAQRVAGISRRAAELQQMLVGYRLSKAQELDREMLARRRGVAQSHDWLAAAGAAYQKSLELNAAGKHESGYQQARRAMRPIRLLERAHWDTTAQSGFSAGAFPLMAFPGGLPAHFDFVARLQQARPEPNRLPGGDCEDLKRMLGAGWRHFRNPQNQIESSADIVAGQVRSGQFALRLRAWAPDPETAPELVETPSVWVVTGGVPLRRGQWVRIHGWTYVPSPIAGNVDGLLAIDSIGGIDLAQRFRATAEWQEFTIYRVAQQDGPVSVTFALSGLGEAWLDDITIEPLSFEPATAATPPIASGSASR